MIQLKFVVQIQEKSWQSSSVVFREIKMADRLILKFYKPCNYSNHPFIIYAPKIKIDQKTFILLTLIDFGDILIFSLKTYQICDNYPAVFLENLCNLLVGAV